MAQETYNSNDALQMTKYAMSLLQQKKVRNHKLKNFASIHTGELERKECTQYCDFLQTKNCDFVLGLRGSK